MTQIIDYRECKRFKDKIKLLPNYEKVLEYSISKVFDYSFVTLQDCLIEGFRWDETPEGFDYWQSVYDSIQYAPKKYCCNNQMRTNDFKKYYRCYVCKKTIYV